MESFIDSGIRRLVDVGVMNERRLSQDKVAYRSLPAYLYLDIYRNLAEQHQLNSSRPQERGKAISYSDCSVDELADDFRIPSPTRRRDPGNDVAAKHSRPAGACAITPWSAHSGHIMCRFPTWTGR